MKKRRPKRNGIKNSTMLDNRGVELRNIFAKIKGKFEFNKEVNGIHYYVVGVWEEFSYQLHIGIADWKRVWANNPQVGLSDQGIWPIILIEYHARCTPEHEVAEYIRSSIIRILDFDDNVAKWHMSLANQEFLSKLPKPKR